MTTRQLTSRIVRGGRRFSGILTWGLMLFVSLMLPAISEAQEGRQCIDEPTDMQIEYGDLITCSIDPVGDSDLFRFEVNEGEKVIVEASRHSGPGTPCIELFRPDGARIGVGCGGQSARIDALLNQPGTYTIRVSENGVNQTVDYALSLDRVAPVPSPTARSIFFESLLEDEINPVGDADLFFFEATAGDRVLVEASLNSGPGTPCIELFRPSDGARIGVSCGGQSARIDVSLNQPGTYTIRASENGVNQTLTYRIHLNCTAGSCVPFNDRVRVLAASFFNQFNLLSVAATSSAAPDTELFVTASGCVTDAPMEFRTDTRRYVFAGFCPGLDGQTVTVTSSRSGSDSAPIDFFPEIPK